MNETMNETLIHETRRDLECARENYLRLQAAADTEFRATLAAAERLRLACAAPVPHGAPSQCANRGIADG